MKRVYLEGRGTGWKLHSLYNELINYPPEGYQFITDEQTGSSGNIDIIHLIDTKIRRQNILETSLENLRPLAYFLYYKVKEKPKPKSIDLTYSSQHLIFRREPWVVDLEHAGALVAYGRLGMYTRLIEKVLGSRYCKKIIPWSDAGKKTLLLNLNCKKFEDKIETVHLAVHSKSFVKEYNKDKVKLLFVGTANIFNVADSFDLKGGKEVLEVFTELNKKYDNLELVIRSYVPPIIENKCSRFSNIQIIDKILPWRLLEKVFISADIFLFPGHQTPGMVFLDGMSYELPIIAPDLWGNSEMIKDGETGFLVEKSQKVSYYKAKYIPKGGTADVMRALRTVDPEFVKKLVEKTSILIEDKGLRRKMGCAARREIETGKFSIEKRNKKLKGIFDEATAS